MPITKSAKKSWRQIKKRTLRNLQQKNTIKKLIKKVIKTTKTGDQSRLNELLRQVQKAIDKAAKKGLLKKQAANRKKSRLLAKIRKMQQK